MTKGQIEFICGGEATLCTAGTPVHIPAGTVHASSFGPGGDEMLEITGRQSEAAAMFTAVDRPIPPGSPDVAEAIRMLGEHGIKVRL